MAKKLEELLRNITAEQWDEIIKRSNQYLSEYFLYENSIDKEKEIYNNLVRRDNENMEKILEEVLKV